MLTTKEQRLFLRLIILGSDSWDKKSLYAIQDWIGAAPATTTNNGCEDQTQICLEWPVLCIGCGSITHNAAKLHYPVIEERCPSCNPKPLATFTGERVWRGIAKLYYIDHAIHFPTIRERNIAIHEALHEALQT